MMQDNSTDTITFRNAPDELALPIRRFGAFLPGEGGKVNFGPAGRSLPQLPLMVEADGYLRAAGPFHEDIGPSWWNVHRRES